MVIELDGSGFEPANPGWLEGVGLVRTADADAAVADVWAEADGIELVAVVSA